MVCFQELEKHKPLCNIKTLTDLDENVDEDNKEGISETGQEPDLHGLDVGGGGEAGGDGEVDRGENHHAGSTTKIKSKMSKSKINIMNIALTC